MKKDKPAEPTDEKLLVPTPEEVAREEKRIDDEERERKRLEADELIRAKSSQRPSPGRIVHYTGADDRTWPAIVSDVDLMQPMVVGLTVFSMAGTKTADAVAYYQGPDAAARRNTWAWPPRT